jgi:outer membrane protein assembly factor BamE (lipoprotein component of BamABCDE complex)
MLRLLLSILALSVIQVSGCDQQGRPLEHPGLDRLRPGISGELDVRGVFGVPEMIVEERDGTRTFQYPLGPEGPRTFFATLGADGKLIRVWNVLVPETFSKIVPGMARDDVRLLLGRPGSQQRYELKRQTAWEWKILDEQRDKRFFVLFDEADKVVSSGIEDPSLSAGR